ncbi:hypothetical protein HPB47_014892, partial [Ixodes persulcatus]
SFAEVGSSRKLAPPKASLATQVYFPDHGKPLKSPKPRLKIALPGHRHSTAKAANAPHGTEDRGPTEVTVATRS